MARWFNSGPAIIIEWQQFHSFLLQRMTARTAEDRLRYAKQYAHVLGSSQVGSSLLQLSPNKRIHVMKAISCLANFMGCHDNWHSVCRKHGLCWSTGTEKIDAFTRFFDSSKDLDTMIQWLRQAMAALPIQYSRFLLFCTMTGLRASECIEAVRLLNKMNEYTTLYYNPEQNILQHYRFPELFIRRTKAVYISVMNDKLLSIAQSINPTPTLNTIKMAIKHRNLSIQLKYCRKIYASFLRQQGLQPEIIDMLQGRIGKNIFLRHYLTPSSSYKTEVLQALEKLQRQL
jgi:intergrase/recombinase